MLYSTSAYDAQVEYGSDTYFLFRQALFSVGGLAAIFIFSMIDYHFYARYAGYFYLFSNLLLLVTKFIGHEVNGAKRWIKIGPIQFQSAEPAKLAIILFLSVLIVQFGKKLKGFKAPAVLFAFGALTFLLTWKFTENLSTAIIILGGIETIATVCEKLVPVMALFYVLGCIVILGINFDYILPAFKAIFTLAFRPGAVAGGLVGGGIRLALQYGVARGLFSNESGMGSAPLVASAAQTRNPVRQALVSATGTFWTTVVVCLVTGLVLISTIMKNPAVDMASIANGGQMTTAAFAQIPYIGPAILVFSIITFAYSTILGWSYYGERAAEYLIGRRAILPYKLVFLAVVVFSPVLALDLVWSIADILNALMAIPNLIAVLLLSGVIAQETRHYLKNLDEEDTTPIPVVDR